MTWLTSPARSINTWLGISAPSGVSFIVGMSVRVQNMAIVRREKVYLKHNKGPIVREIRGRGKGNGTVGRLL